jgi:type VI secretion system protein VasD
MTMLSRRTIVAGGAAAIALVACGPQGPGTLTVAASAAAGANRGPDGADRPLTLTVIQMRGSSAFDGADFFALQNPSAALGGDFIKADQIVLVPGSTASRVIGIEAGAGVIGIVAGFRDPAGKVFRVKTAAPATGNAGVAVTVGAGGLSVGAA